MTKSKKKESVWGLVCELGHKSRWKESFYNENVVAHYSTIVLWIWRLKYIKIVQKVVLFSVEFDPKNKKKMIQSRLGA